MSKNRYKNKDPKAAKRQEEAAEEEAQEKWTLKGFLIDIAKDIVIAFAIMIVVVVSLWIYTGNWPPLVVVESQSMMHDTDSELGAIDTGDLVLVKAVDQDDIHNEITTWVDHKDTHYGTYGDVIIYKKNGGKDTPVIHRAVVWLEANYTEYNENTQNGASYDIPSMKLYGQTGKISIQGYPDFQGGDDKITLTLDLGDILLRAKKVSQKPLSGFITKGDNNGNQMDQFYLTDESTGNLINPIRPQWIIGKAQGELPWFGLMKLYVMGKVPGDAPAPQTSKYMLIVTIVGLIIIAIALDFAISFISNKLKERKKREEEVADKGGEKKGGRKRGEKHMGRYPPKPPDIKVEDRPYSDALKRSKASKKDGGRPIKGRPAPGKPASGKKEWKMDGRRRL